MKYFVYSTLYGGWVAGLSEIRLTQHHLSGAGTELGKTNILCILFAANFIFEVRVKEKRKIEINKEYLIIISSS